MKKINFFVFLKRYKMSAKHDFLVVQDGPKMIHLEQLLSQFCQNLYPEIINSKCISQVFMDRQKVA